MPAFGYQPVTNIARKRRNDGFRGHSKSASGIHPISDFWYIRQNILINPRLIRSLFSRLRLRQSFSFLVTRYFYTRKEVVFAFNNNI
jgi:hypothetical protein